MSSHDPGRTPALVNAILHSTPLRMREVLLQVTAWASTESAEALAMLEKHLLVAAEEKGQAMLTFHTPNRPPARPY